MQAIIQHTFNSGLGDCVVAVSEYLHNAQRLKKLGYNITLNINTTNNLYYNDLNLFDIFDIKSFSIFNNINIINSSKDSYDGYLVNHISYGASKPGLHWWDLFLSCEDNFTVDTFPQNGLFFNNLINDNNIVFNPSIYETFNKLNHKNYDVIYLRPNDCEDNLKLYNIKKEKIDSILKKSDKVFVCSNSHKIKEQFCASNIFKLNIPMENLYGNHIYNNLKIDTDISKIRTQLAVLEMVILSKANRIYFATSWGRVSNFLYFAILNKVPIIYL